MKGATWSGSFVGLTVWVALASCGAKIPHHPGAPGSLPIAHGPEAYAIQQALVPADKYVPIGLVMERTFYKDLEQLTSPPSLLPGQKPGRRSTQQPSGQASPQPTEQSGEESAQQPSDQASEQPTEQSGEQSTEEPNGENGNQSSEESSEESNGENGNQSSEESSEESNGENGNQSSEESNGESNGENGEQSTEQTTDNQSINQPFQQNAVGKGCLIKVPGK